MFMRTGNGSGLILLTLKRVGKARAHKLLREIGMIQRSFYADLATLVRQGLVDRLK